MQTSRCVCFVWRMFPVNRFDLLTSWICESANEIDFRQSTALEKETHLLYSESKLQKNAEKKTIDETK